MHLYVLDYDTDDWILFMLRGQLPENHESNIKFDIYIVATFWMFAIRFINKSLGNFCTNMAWMPANRLNMPSIIQYTQ